MSDLEEEILLESPTNFSFSLGKSFPIETQEELQRMEEELTDLAFEKKLITVFAELISLNRQAFLRRIVSPKLIINYNWNGTRNKLPLNKYYMIHTVLRKAYGTSLYEFEQAMKVQVRRLHNCYHKMVFENRNKLKYDMESMPCLTKIPKISSPVQPYEISHTEDTNLTSQIDDIYDASPKLQCAIRSVYRQLNRMGEFLETIVDIMGTHFYNNNKTTEITQVSDSFDDIFPIETQSDFNQFVNNLETDQAYRDLISKKCRRIFEKYQNNFLQILITDNVLYEYNWDGTMRKKSMRMDPFFSEVLLDVTGYDIQTYIDSIREQILESHNRTERRKSLGKLNIEYPSHNVEEIDNIIFDEETYEEDQDVDETTSGDPICFPELFKSTQEVEKQRKTLYSKIEQFHNPNVYSDQEFPLNTEEELNNLSEKLKDPEYYSKMTDKCTRVISLNPDTFLRHFATVDLLFDYNWDGYSSKKALKNHRFFNTILYEASGKDYTSFVKSTKIQIRKAHDRFHKIKYDRIHRKTVRTRNNL